MIELYEDVYRSGGLIAAIQAALASIASGLRAADLDWDPEIRNGFPAYARVEEGHRFSQVYMAAEERLFLVDFWDRGVCMGNAATPSLADLARIMHAWIEEKANLAAMSGRFPIFKAARAAAAFEEGRAVDARWEAYLDAVASPDCRTPIRELRPVLLEASRNARLRALFPFTSLWTLCFSRCTGYPYTRDCPAITPLRDGRFRVTTMDGNPLGEGSAEEVVEFAVRHLPPNCGLAVPGTSDDLKKDESPS